MDSNAIQELINKYCTKDFCVMFMQELHNIYGLAVTDFLFDPAWDIEGMSGADVALAMTCEATSNDELFKQYYYLTWEELDDFEVMLKDKLVEYGLLLPTSEIDEIARQYKIPVSEVVVCFDCFGIKRKSEVRLRIDLEVGMSDYICNRCYNGGESEDLVMDQDEVIQHYFSKRRKDVVQCRECERYYWGFNTKDGRCNHCIIHADNFDSDHMYNNVYYMAGYEAKEKYIEKLGLEQKIDPGIFE